MSVPRTGHLRGIAACMLALLASASLARAQDAVITGTVTNPQGQPIEAASVVITSMNAGGITTTAGTYTIRVSAANVKGQTVSVIARRIGFSPVTKQIALTSGEQTLDFTLNADVRRLDEVVVTGVAKATSLKNTTISIAKLSEDQLQRVPANDVVSALGGKVAGVRVQQTTGVPGQDASIRLRGSTSLQIGASAPLFLVDGVISKNGLADIDPQDIVSIEVLKGAASANTYGSEAANGVIAITTNRGKSLAEGQLAITARTEIGQTSIEHYVPLAKDAPYELNADGTFAETSAGNRIVKSDYYVDNPYPTTGPDAWRNQLKTWLKSNVTKNNYVSMGYRKGTTNFFSSFSLSSDPGIMPMVQGFRRKNFRFNVDQGLNDQIDFSGSFLYGQDDNDQDNNVTGTGTFFALLQAPPDLDLAHPNGGDSTLYSNVMPGDKAPDPRGNPLNSLANVKYNRHVDRLFGSFTARYRPTGWLSFDASYGTDHFHRLTTNYTPRGILNTSGRSGNGSLDYSTDKDVATNTQVNATATYGMYGLNATTRLTFLYEGEDDVNFDARGNKFNIGQTPTLDALDPTQLTVGSGESTIRSQNYYITQDLNFRDRYLFQALFRRDGSSLFGAAARWRNYYGISGAWRVTQDFHIPGFQELKLRSAIGTSGLRPGFDWQYETYNVNGGAISKATLGNTLLEPAQQRETEVGINASFLQRFDAEVVKSDRTTTDAFLRVPLSRPLNGGFTSQWRNAATIGARTLELSLTTRVIEHPNFSYDFTLTADRTKQKIDALGVPPYSDGNGSQGQNIFFYRAGEDLGVIYGKRWARSLSELLDDPANAGMTLDQLSQTYSVNSDGYVVKTADKGTKNERTIAYVGPDGSSNVKIGNVNPDFNFGWANTMRYKGFTLYALFDGSHGGQIYNFTKQWMFQDWRHADIDQAGKPQDDKHAFQYYTIGLYNNLEPNSYFVEDGSYVKLRELSVSYELSKSMIGKLGLGRWAKSLKVALIGRNLKTWTSYDGFDPEAAAAGDFNLRIDGFRYPTFRQVSGQVQIGF